MKMKPKQLLTTGLITGACCMAVLSANAQSTFTLKGTIQGMDGQTLYLISYEGENAQTDSVAVKDGAFLFSGTINGAYKQATLVAGDRKDYRNPYYKSLFLEPAEMTITIDPAHFRKATVTGSANQADQDNLEAISERIMAEAAELSEALKNEKNHEKAAEIREKLEPYQERVKQAQIEFVKQHPSSYAAAQYLRFLSGSLPYAELKEVYDNFDEAVKTDKVMKEIKEELQALAGVQPGMPAPDICKEDWKGQTVSISSLKGKVVLVDFWASWCVPCRKSFPHVKALYEKYHDKGLEVFCISDDDSNPKKWYEAIEKDGLQEFYHVLRGLKIIRDENGAYKGHDRSEDVSERYAIHFLPTKYLIDREGKIIGKFNDEELDIQLKQLFE